MSLGQLRLRRQTLLSQTSRKRPSIGKTFFVLLFFLLDVTHGMTACHCDTLSNEFLFTNEGDSVRHYSIMKSGSAASWSTVSPMSFSLGPGETRQVVAFTRVPCEASAGVKDLVLKALSSDDVIEQRLDFSVSSCHDITISHDSTIDACVNEELVVPVTLVNDGEFSENVSLSSSVGFIPESLSLEPNESSVVDLVLTPVEIGLLPVSISAVYAESSDSDLVVNVSECSFFGAGLSQSFVSLCEDESKEITLMINNQGPEKRFHISSSSPLISVPESIIIGANSSEEVVVTVLNGCDSSLLDAIISVWAEGASMIQLPLSLNLKDCALPILVPEVGQLIGCSCEDLVFKFNLLNPSSSELTYALSSSVGNLSDSLVTLPGGGQHELLLSYLIPCDFTGDLSFEVTAKSVIECSKSSSALVNLSVSSWSDCERVSVDGPVAVPVNGSELVVPVSVRNIGSRVASYTVLVSGSAVSNLLGLSKSFMTLDPGDAEVVELLFDATDLTGGYVSVQAFTTDNLASDSVMISFGSGLNDFDLYFLVIPAAVIALVVAFLVRGKFFNKIKPSKK